MYLPVLSFLLCTVVLLVLYITVCTVVGLGR